MKRQPRIPGRRVVWINGRPVVMKDSEVRAWIREYGKRKKKGKK